MAHPLGIVPQGAVVQQYLFPVQVTGEDAELPNPKAVVQAAVQIGPVLHRHVDGIAVIHGLIGGSRRHRLHQVLKLARE